jgi:hypothetical protein
MYNRSLPKLFEANRLTGMDGDRDGRTGNRFENRSKIPGGDGRRLDQLNGRCKARDPFSSKPFCMRRG